MIMGLREQPETAFPTMDCCEAVRRCRDLSKLFRAGKSFPTRHRVFEVFPGIATDSVMLKPDRAGVIHLTQQPQHLRYIVRAAVQWLDQLFPARAASVRAVDGDAEQIWR